MGHGFGAGHHQHHSRGSLSLARIDLRDLRMRLRAADDGEMQIMRRAEIIDVTSPAGDDASIFAARDRLADFFTIRRQAFFEDGERLRAAGRDFQRMQNIVVAGAPTDISRQRLARVVVAELTRSLSLKKITRAHQHASGAVTTLQCVTLHKGLLQRREFSAGCKRFGCGDPRPVRLRRQHQTGFD